jgi:hypothetical protein
MSTSSAARMTRCVPLSALEPNAAGRSGPAQLRVCAPPTQSHSQTEVFKLLELALGCAIHCDRRQEFIDGAAMPLPCHARRLPPAAAAAPTPRSTGLRSFHCCLPSQALCK